MLYVLRDAFLRENGICLNTKYKFQCINVLRVWESGVRFRKIFSTFGIQIEIWW